MTDLDPRPAWLPQTVLLLGTDASGKNHVAHAWLARYQSYGVQASVSEGWLSSAPVDHTNDHAEKSWSSRTTEKLFLWLFPLMTWCLPTIVAWLMRRDARKFSTRQCDDATHRIVVSHSALRVLAFCLGQRREFIQSRTLAPHLRRAVSELVEHSRAVVIVLDIDDATRRKRLQQRCLEGSADPFDRFMLADSHRSENIEDSLVWLAQQLMGAEVIVNDDLSDAELWAAFESACRASVPRPSASR